MSKQQVKNLKIIHGVKTKDFLGYKINKGTILSRHHIIKKVYYQIDNISNYILLTTDAHTWLHNLELTDRQLYNELTYFWLKVKEENRVLDDDYFNDLNKILKKER